MLARDTISGFVRLLAVLVTIASLQAPARARAAPSAIDSLRHSYQRPNAIPFPADNPYSDVKSALGEQLFFDPRLSANGTMSCATCHNPAFSWQDGQKVAFGHAENRLPRATPTLLDLAWCDLMMWDGRKNDLEDQASGPVSTPAEMGGSLDGAAARVGALPAYRDAFQAIFGGPVTFPRIARALATFERTLVSNQAPFDRWIAGDQQAIDARAKRGFVLFNGRAHCAACHSGWRFTDDAFHDIGLRSDDPGRGRQVPDEPVLMHAFKTPTLRNVALRAPYMHDGSLSTLRDVIVEYDTGFIDRPSLSPDMHRLGLSDRDKDDLVAFLRTLTSVDDTVATPNLPTKEQN